MKQRLDDETIWSEGVRRLASGLAASALLCDDDEELAQERVSPFLDTLYKLTPDAQSHVVSNAFDMLRYEQKSSAEGWLLDELEFQAQIRAVSLDGRDCHAVTFSVPVLVTGDSIPVDLLGQEVSELEEILVDYDVIHSSAKVRIVPRLYSLDELLVLSWGDVAKLSESAFHADGEGGFDWAPAAQPAQDSEHVKLRFLLGVLLLDEVDAQDAFPSLGSDESEDDDVMGQLQHAIGLAAPGQDEQGLLWTTAFEECLTRAGGHELAVLAVVPPEGFYFDVLAGMREWRAMVFRVGFDAHIEQLDLAPEDLAYEIQPGQAEDDEAVPFLVRLYQDGSEIPTLTLEWFSLPEEPTQTAFDELMELLEELGLAPKTKIFTGNLFRLH